MPLYEYECQQCRKHTEKIQKFSDPEITTCPHCGGPLQRVITAPAIAFKGGGWFKDGYGNAKPAAAAAGDTKSSDSGNSGGSTDTAPATKSDTNAAPSTAAPAATSAPAASAPAAPAASSSEKK